MKDDAEGYTAYLQRAQPGPLDVLVRYSEGGQGMGKAGAQPENQHQAHRQPGCRRYHLFHGCLFV